MERKKCEVCKGDLTRIEDYDGVLLVQCKRCPHLYSVSLERIGNQREFMQSKMPGCGLNLPTLSS